MPIVATVQGHRVRKTLAARGAFCRFVATLLSGPQHFRLSTTFTTSGGQFVRPSAAEPAATACATSPQRLRESILIALSHDLRGPLTSVVGLGESLLQSTPVLAQNQADLAIAMRDEALRMSEMVSNLLDILRIQGNGLTLKREWQVLEENVGCALRASTQRLKQCLVTTDLPGDFPLVRFDAVLIERVMVNLIENAAKFAGPKAHLGIAAVERGPWAEISVYDNGPGIPLGNEKYLFERFSRCDGAAEKPGHGLGLSICRAIVEAHGGMIGTSPSPYGGAGFTFSLPMEFPAPLPVSHGNGD